MSKSSSPYIEASKHPELTRMVEGHFFNGADPHRLVNAPPGGDPSMGSGMDMPMMPDTGVNQMPHSHAGHKVGMRK
jgi:hypothetical protein